MDATRIVVLGRDGVINHRENDCIRSPDEWEALPGSLEAITRLHHADYRVVVMTHQWGIAEGFLTLNTLNRIHQKMLTQLHALGGEIDAIFFCPHGSNDVCVGRQSLAGLWGELQQRLKCHPQGVDAVGDSLAELQAAEAAGAQPVLVRTGKGKITEETLHSGDWEGGFREVAIHQDLAAYVESLHKRGRLGP